MINLDDYEEVRVGDIRLKDDEIVLRKKKKPGLWVPEEGEDYWYLVLHGRIAGSRWTNSAAEQTLLKNNAIFRTKEQAEWASKHTREYNRLLRAVSQVECWEPDWDDIGLDKYNFKYMQGGWDWGRFSLINYAAGPVVSTQKNAERVLELLNS